MTPIRTPREAATAAWVVEAGRIARFGIVGGLATATYFATALTAATVLNMSPVAASTAGLSASTFVSYFGHLHLSFRVEPDHQKFVARFVTLVLASLVITTGATAILTDVLHVGHIATLCVVSGLIPAINYLLNRYWVFLPGFKPVSGPPRADPQAYDGRGGRP